ncbi:hypothetical protein DMA11_11675 [Marinilabiliaceae bacterium JC017]|nr:hypothetical protein DMA11_11675 [Marinilabiliaceae bacterium JC017]
MPVKINTINTLKKELEFLPKEEIIQYCLRLAKYKKDNKELLNYLLFEADDEAEYIRQIKEEIEAEFKGVNRNTLYFAKKSIRRIHRIVTKHIRYSGSKQTEVELLIFFCLQMRQCGVAVGESKVLVNLYQRQLKTIDKTLGGLHEDLQVDYQEELEEIRKVL